MRQSSSQVQLLLVLLFLGLFFSLSFVVEIRYGVHRHITALQAKRCRSVFAGRTIAETIGVQEKSMRSLTPEVLAREFKQTDSEPPDGRITKDESCGPYWRLASRLARSISLTFTLFLLPSIPTRVDTLISWSFAPSWNSFSMVSTPRLELLV
jgi:hypothetical protein